MKSLMYTILFGILILGCYCITPPIYVHSYSKQRSVPGNRFQSR